MRDAPTETIFSLSGEAPGEGATIAVADADAKSLKPGAVVRGSLRHLCSVRKLTAGGAVLHLDSPVEPGERLTLDLATGQIVAGCVEWRRGGQVGIRFDEFFDVFGVIARDLASQVGERRRMPRIELRCPVRIESPVGSELAATRDVSQGGVKVETRLVLQPEQPVLVELDGFRPLDGIVRWTEGGIAGIAFSPEPGWQEMMPWLRERRDRARRARPIAGRTAAASPSGR
jgi:hypothetical protein